MILIIYQQFITYRNVGKWWMMRQPLGQPVMCEQQVGACLYNLFYNLTHSLNEQMTPHHCLLTRNVVIPPFTLDTLCRTAFGQFCKQIDKIQELHKVETFHDTINAYIELHPHHKPQKEDQLPEFITRVIGSWCIPDCLTLRLHSVHLCWFLQISIHNAYLLAATWKIIHNALCNLKEHDLNNLAMSDQLKSDDNKCDTYLLVWDCVSMLLKCVLQELKMDVACSSLSPSL